MKLFFILAMAAMTLLPSGSFAEDRYECLLRCSAERDSRNADCPSPYDSSNSSQRDQCLKISQTAYTECFNNCPPPPPSPPSSEEQPSPPPMAY